MKIVSIIVIAAGLFAIFFPKYSTFFYSYNFNTKKVENKYETRSEAELVLRRIKGGLFVTVGIFFLLGSCAIDK
ncbi:MULTISPECIES: hypothetical protein [unclassified Paenibacillus]|uniref:hypothetical protein n=1 Tax=unclassified Paenibacillus TaxID=185978 RepID=UPI003624E5E5